MPQPISAPAPATGGNPNLGPDPNVNAPSDPGTLVRRGINPVTGRRIPMPFGAESAMLQPGQNPFGPSGGVPLPTGSTNSFTTNQPPITSPGINPQQFNISNPTNAPITSPGVNPGGGNAGMVQLGPDGQPIGVTPDFNPAPQNLNLGGGVTNATTNQGGTGQVPQTGDGSPTLLGDGSIEQQLFGQGGIPLTGGPGSADDNSFGSLLRGYGKTFQAPTDVTEQDDPGYKFRLQQGNDAIQRSAAARGGLLTGGTAKALSDYAQGSASQEYGNVYNRALSTFDNNYNQFNNDQTNKFNRLASLAGFGQTAAGQLSNAGNNAANNVSSTLLTSGQQIGNDIQNAGAARASGYVGGANAVGGAINNGTGSLTNAILLSQFL